MEYFVSCRLPIWIGILAVIVSSTIADDDNFCPISDYDCSQNGVDCSIIRDPECSWTPDEAQKVSEYPGPVTDFSIKPYYLPPESKVPPNSISRVEISWSLPEHETHKYLTGFKVRLIQPNFVPYCFIFKLNISDRSIWNELDKSKFTYTLNCEKLHNRGYTIDVTSLPDAPFSDKRASAMLKIVQKYKDDQTHDCSDPSDGNCWDTDMVIYNDPCSRTIRVTFNRAPDLVGIRRYKVILMPHDKLFPDTYVNITKIPTTEFLEGVLKTSSLTLPLNERVIRVSPQCLYNQCRDSLSQTFDITNATATECTFVPPVNPDTDQLSTPALIGIIVAAVVVAGGLTALITTLARRKMRPGQSSKYGDLSRSGSFGSGDTFADQPTRLVFPPDHERLRNRKMVFLLYSNDSPQHRTVIGNLHAFLESKNLNVVFDMIHLQQSHQNIMSWTKEYMTKCDYILLVNSKGTFLKSHGYTYPMFDSSCIGDTFSPGLTILLEDLQHPQPVLIHKVVMCHFEYTAYEHSCIPMIPIQDPTKPSYRLMNDMNEMLGRLGHSGSYNRNGDRTGQSLETAISMKRQFVGEKPNWFEAINGQPGVPIRPHDSGFFTMERSGANCNPGFISNGSPQIPHSVSGSPFVRPASIPDDIISLDESELGREVSNSINS